jgi:hypothetical protein
VISYLTHRNIAFGLAVTIGLGAFAGSARELWRIAETAHYGLPLGLVAALDGLAVVCVIVLSRHRDWQAACTLAATTLLSIGLQVLAVAREEVVNGVTVDVPMDRYVSAVAVHALVPLASFMAIHLATRLDRPGPATGKPRRARPVPKPEPRPAPAPEVKPTPLRPPAPEATPLRPAARTDDDLVALAVEIAEALNKAPADLSRTELQDGVKEHPSRKGVGIGTKRAGAILDQLRTPPMPELEVVR